MKRTVYEVILFLKER